MAMTQSDSDTINLTFADPCIDANFVSISAVSQGTAGTAVNSYDDSAFTLSYTPYTVTPSFCTLFTECLSVSPENAALPCQELDQNN